MNAVRTLALLITLALAAACSSAVRYALLGTRAYPTTEGEARIEARDDGGYDVVVDVDNLPGLDRLGEGLTVYVLWLTPTGTEAPTRAGVLTLDPTTRTGHATARSTSPSFAIRVTGEVDANVEAPSDAIVVDALLQPAN